MKYIILVLIIALWGFSNKMVSGSCANRMTDEDNNGNNSSETLSFTMNKFTFNLFQTLVKSSNENILFFPLNIAKLLFMMFFGSAERVALQIETVLDVYLQEATFHKEIHNFFYEWTNSKKSHIYKAIDNMYVDSSVSIHRSYKRILRMFYPNRLKSVHFPKARVDINTLFALRSYGFIRNIVTEKDVTPDMLLLLLSVVFFSGEWNDGLQSTTKETSLENEDFIPNSEFVPASLNYRKYEDINCQMVELPMENKSISLLLVVPSQLENFKTFMSIMNTDIFHSWVNLEGFEKTQVFIQKVNINLQCHLHLEKILPKLGITNLFKKPGGLSAMSSQKDLFVNKFIQKSFMQINAGTEIGTGNANHHGGGVVIEVNAPYLFFIVDKDTKMVISAGSVVDQ